MSRGPSQEQQGVLREPVFSVGGAEPVASPASSRDICLDLVLFNHRVLLPCPPPSTQGWRVWDEGGPGHALPVSSAAGNQGLSPP